MSTFECEYKTQKEKENIMNQWGRHSTHISFVSFSINRQTDAVFRSGCETSWVVRRGPWAATGGQNKAEICTISRAPMKLKQIAGRSDLASDQIQCIGAHHSTTAMDVWVCRDVTRPCRSLSEHMPTNVTIDDKTMPDY